MPAKNPNKKARWSAAEKAAASTKGPKKPYHRGQKPADDAPRGAKRPVRAAEDRPRRVRKDGAEDQGQRRWERREDSRPGGFRSDDRRGGGFRSDDRRSDDRRGGFRSDDRRGGGFRSDDRRGGGFRSDDRRGGGFRSDDRRSDDRRGGGFRSDDRRTDDRRGGGFRSDDRRGGGFRSDDRRGGGFRSDDRRADDRRGGFRSDDRRTDDRRGGFRSDDRRTDDRRGGYRGDDRRDGGFRSDDRRGGSREGFRRGPRDERQGYRPRFDREQTSQDHHQDAEAERMEADSWVSAARTTTTEPVTVAEDNGFAALGLPERLVERLAREGISSPFPIQEATIPDALAGKDVLGRGQTGSGKTLAFGLPTIARLSGERSKPRRPRALVLVPTRELAMQVSDSLEPLVHVAGLRHKLVAGGLSYTGQIAALDKGVDLLIATPGRLVDLLDREAVILDSIEVTILDEADHMADMGFVPAVTRVLDEVPEGGQRLLFSATLDKGVDTLVQRYLVDPVTHSTNDATASVDTMEHHILVIDPQHKKVITAEVANREGRTVVFCRTKLGADRVALQLRESGVRAAALHGGLTQGARNKVLGAFRTGRIPVLVATDVAARGIHVDDVSVVLQADPPADHKDYLHRAGRTARAGERGTVVTLALPHQRKMMERMATDAGLEARPVKAAPGDEVLEAAGAAPVSGVPIDEADFRKLLDPRPARRHGGTGGPRGARTGGQYRGGGQRRGPRHG
ncbi:DEAD/DEAH box helicase [Janibacter melonis]|uniref:DEAD/DEAH box helicase n=1 Tax=Janibacter melonis TaxID=262209 RepID=UPI0017488770|nr:DEAD/DEAH box helicase [Janibacter melonis]